MSNSPWPHLGTSSPTPLFFGLSKIRRAIMLKGTKLSNSARRSRRRAPCEPPSRHAPKGTGGRQGAVDPPTIVNFPPSARLRAAATTAAMVASPTPVSAPPLHSGRLYSSSTAAASWAAWLRSAWHSNIASAQPRSSIGRICRHFEINHGW
jgi:hypothetical protein